MRTRATVVGSLVMNLALSVPRLPTEGDHGRRGLVAP